VYIFPPKCQTLKTTFNRSRDDVLARRKKEARARPYTRIRITYAIINYRLFVFMFRVMVYNNITRRVTADHHSQIPPPSLLGTVKTQMS